jgi:hypothetical protein
MMLLLLLCGLVLALWLAVVDPWLWRRYCRLQRAARARHLLAEGLFWNWRQN